MTIDAAEAMFLAARDAADALAVARTRGVADEALEAEAASARVAADAALAALATGDLAAEDRRAVRTMREALDGLATGRPGADRPRDELAALSGALEERYTRAGEAIRVRGTPASRLEILGRLATEPDPAHRRELFLALEPLWHAIDGGREPPYRRLIERSSERWHRGGSPIASNAAALGIDESAVEAWCRATLAAWRDTFVGSSAAPIEPWDWWWAAGEAERSTAPLLPVERLVPIAASWHRALGADPDALGIRLDVVARPGRPPIPVAHTTFGRRPRSLPGGGHDPGEPWVFATYASGGLGELTELVHEIGHAIHIAAIRTRPAFADWPDSDAFTEALAELLTLDTAEPEWQRRWLGPGMPDIPIEAAMRERYAAVALDAAWALFEIELHRDPDRRPSDVWTEITADWLGIAQHPEWSWWAIRGQLVQEPGYMANYAIGAVIAADLRAALRRDRGDWLAGDPGWYRDVSQRLYRFGRERPSGDVLRDVLGRAPVVDALVDDIRRARS